MELTNRSYVGHWAAGAMPNSRADSRGSGRLNGCHFASHSPGVNTMRTIHILAAIGLSALATAPIAQAGLIGAQVTYEYFLPVSALNIYHLFLTNTNDHLFYFS